MPTSGTHFHVRKLNRGLMLLLGAGMLVGAFTLLALARDGEPGGAGQVKTMTIGIGRASAAGGARIISCRQLPTMLCGAGFRSTVRRC